MNKQKGKEEKQVKAEDEQVEEEEEEEKKKKKQKEEQVEGKKEKQVKAEDEQVKEEEEEEKEEKEEEEEEEEEEETDLDVEDVGVEPEEDGQIVGRLEEARPGVARVRPRHGVQQVVDVARPAALHRHTEEHDELGSRLPTTTFRFNWTRNNLHIPRSTQNAKIFH